MKSQDGFTLVELLVAMAVFSSMLVIVSVSFIGIIKIHERGLAVRTVQQNAREALDDLVRSTHNASTGTIPATGQPRICFNTGVEYILTGHDLYELSGVSGCPDSSAGGIKINDSNVWVVGFKFSKTDALANTNGTIQYDITTTTSYGQAQQLPDGSYTCNDPASSQYCDIYTEESSATLGGAN